MKQETMITVDVKNLCSRKLWELAESSAVDSGATLCASPKNCSCAATI